MIAQFDESCAANALGQSLQEEQMEVIAAGRILVFAGAGGIMAGFSCPEILLGINRLLKNETERSRFKERKMDKRK